MKLRTIPAHCNARRCEEMERCNRGRSKRGRWIRGKLATKRLRKRLERAAKVLLTAGILKIWAQQSYQIYALSDQFLTLTYCCSEIRYPFAATCVDQVYHRYTIHVAVRDWVKSARSGLGIGGTVKSHPNASAADFLEPGRPKSFYPC
jgi:hypothetical protein